MVLKINLEKAYDRLEWHFISDILNHFKFPTNLVKLIMSCVSSSSISMLLNEANLWDPMKASRNDPSFSHLFFMDDLVLFAQADRKNCCNVRETLDSFCELSGQKASLHKSKVYFSPNIDPNLREEVCDTGHKLHPKPWEILRCSFKIARVVITRFQFRYR